MFAEPVFDSKVQRAASQERLIVGILLKGDMRDELISNSSLPADSRKKRLYNVTHEAPLEKI